MEEEELFEVSIHPFSNHGNVVYFKFNLPNGNEDYGIFRSNRFYFNGSKLPSSLAKAKKFVPFYTNNIQGKVLKAILQPFKLKDLFYKDVDGKEIKPNFFATYAWLGNNFDPKIYLSNNEKTDNSKQEDKEVLENVEGTMVYRALSGMTYIEFNLNSSIQVASFNCKCLFLDGELINPIVFYKWPKNKKEKVTFNAISSFNIPEHVYIEKSGENGMEFEVAYKSQWKCTAVWIGSKPSTEKIDTLMSMTKKSDKMDTSEYEYGCGRLIKYVDRCTGIIMAKKEKRDRPILFKITDLSIDGKKFSPEINRLSSVIAIGEVLSFYVKPLVPLKNIADITCHDIAIEVWKGKRSAANSEETVKYQDRNLRSLMPNPSEATHKDQLGKIIELDGSYGKAELESDDHAINGQRVLIIKSRTFVNGQKIQKFKCFLHEHFKIGDKIKFNMKIADAKEACGEYEWLALVSWSGEDPPNTDESGFDISSKRVDSYRGRIIKLDDPDQSNTGVSSGILQITGGPNCIGEKVFFHRQNTYIFGACMAKADLRYMISEQDKMQLEIESLSSESLEEYKNTYSCDIKYKASIAYIGPLPKLDKNCDDFPFYVGNVIYPYLARRGIDEEFFTRLIKGEIPPKVIYQDSQIKGIPPNVVTARFIELKAPDSNESFCSHGICVIENGPYSNEKAFISRQVIWCFGYHMANSDLMKIIKESDRFCVELQGGTNNKSVPFKIISAWIGPHPSEKINLNMNSVYNSEEFLNWLETHEFKGIEEFESCVKGQLPPKPFFPLPQETQNARIVHMFPSLNNLSVFGDGSKCGILKIYQGSLAKKDVLFERNNVYIWNVNFNNGDMNYILKESDRVFCEVSEIIGKDRKKWQARFGIQNIPKYFATLVYIGGGRPKCNNKKLLTLEALNENLNLKQWLAKRGVDVEKFYSVINGKLPPKIQKQETEVKNNDLKEFSLWDSQQKNNVDLSHSNLNQHQNSDSLSNNTISNAFENPIMKQAKLLLNRTMSCTSPEDHKIKEIIQNDQDVELALFISQSLENAVKAYKCTNLGPIAPPSKNKQSYNENSYFQEYNQPIQSSQNKFQSQNYSSNDYLMGYMNPPNPGNSNFIGKFQSNIMGTSWEDDWSRRPTRRESQTDFSRNEPPFKRKSTLGFNYQ